METQNHTDQLRRLIEAVVADARSLRSRLPQQLLFSLADARVQAVLDQRFRAGQVLSDIHTLPVQEATGLLPLWLAFDFTTSVRLPQNGVLILLDHTTSVVGIDEQFVPEKPNPHVTLPTSEDRIPFALATSKSGRLQRVIPEASLKRLRQLEADFVVSHGILSQFYPEEGSAVDGNTTITLDTECSIPTPFTYDTPYTIINDETGEITHEEIVDNGVEYVKQTDDSQSMTLNELLDGLGLRPI